MTSRPCICLCIKDESPKTICLLRAMHKVLVNNYVGWMHAETRSI